ncbi:MAG: TIGR00730 family Rossman fold protein, partial [Acutalibacteraceae bacterium]|nr:TIGR00730 family Rossman fold protein [Acutalibacteraceae bacterium]
MKICVYGSASPTIDKKYIEITEEMGKTMVQRGHSLVFGGGGNGLMGATARGVKSQGGYILGVIPTFFRNEEIEAVCDFCDKLIEPDTMRERKQIMEENCDAFIVVPGGIGTYEEFFEILTSKQLCRHNKPIAIYNQMGYYNELYATMKQAVKKNFIKPDCLELFKMSENLDELFSYLEGPQKQRTVK